MLERSYFDDYDKIPDEDLEIDYIPVKFEKTFTPDEESAFLPMVTTTETKKHFGTINVGYAYDSLTYKEGDVIQDTVRLLGRKEVFSKNSERCM